MAQAPCGARSRLSQVGVLCVFARNPAPSRCPHHAPSQVAALRKVLPVRVGDVVVGQYTADSAGKEVGWRGLRGGGGGKGGWSLINIWVNLVLWWWPQRRVIE